MDKDEICKFTDVDQSGKIRETVQTGLPHEMHLRGSIVDSCLYYGGEQLTVRLFFNVLHLRHYDLTLTELNRFT